MSAHRTLQLGIVGLFAAAGLALAQPAASAADLSAAQLTGALHWRSVGPYTGGRVTSVAGFAGQPNRFLAAYADGGIWETDDYGIHWKNISDKGIDTGVIGAIAVAPSNPKIIYAGTGDPAVRNTFLTGDGMYKSTDGGKTWQHIGLGKTEIISWIEVDPRNPDIVYAAALGHIWAPNPERGVYKSTDGGKTWKKVLFVNNDTGAITMAMDPSNPNVLYATMWQAYRRPWTFSSGGPGSGIYKTTDGGRTWTNITHNQGLPSGIFGKVGIALAPNDPKVVYALIQAKVKPGKPGGLYRSEDGGHSWKLMNDSLDITQRAFYYMRVYVDPKDANTIYLPNVGVYVSHNGGKKLISLHPPHGDNHAFWINPRNPQTLIEGNDGGATVSQNGGKSWSTEDNQPTGQFYHVNLDDQFPYHIWGAQQDRGSVESPSAVPFGGIPGVWHEVIGGEMSWVVPKPGDPNESYGSGYYSMQWKENRRLGLITNIGAWPAYKFGLDAAKVKYRYGWWFHPVVTIPDEPNALLVGAQAVLETLDGGQHWKQISPDLTRNDKSKQERSGGPISADVTGEESFDTLSTIGVSPLNHQIIWTGSDDGLVYVTKDGGAHWSEVRPPQLPKWSTITTVEPSHSALGTAYVSAMRYQWDDFHPYVYKTTDYGQHWTSISAGIPDNQYTTSIRQDPSDPNLLLLGTNATVYMSFDDGAHWQPLTLNLPHVRVTDIAFQPQQHAVVLSTFGRAFWVLDNVQFLEQLGTAKVAGNAAYLFKPQQAWLVTRGGGFGGRSRTGNMGQNLPSGATVFFHLPSDYRGQRPVELSFTDADGKVIRSFTLPEQPKATKGANGKKPKAKKLNAGMNRFVWDLRYPDATDVKGIYNSFFSAGKPVGPEVLPGTYYAVLKYAGHTEKQPFVIKLDPRLNTTPAELQQRFALSMQIHESLNQLDTAINSAIAMRATVEKAIADKRVSGPVAEAAVAGLNRDINNLVNFKIQSGEGALVYPPRLRSWMTSIASQVGFALVAPTPAMQQVAKMYIDQANAASAKLKSDVANVNAGLDRGFK
ncbi:MAG TPA: hypothetical protein VF292_14855 [Rhodanobacteraceae bacterium]